MSMILFGFGHNLGSIQIIIEGKNILKITQISLPNNHTMENSFVLTFAFPQILLVSDYFYAFLRREHHLTYGLYLKRKDGSEATLVLK